MSESEPLANRIRVAILASAVLRGGARYQLSCRRHVRYARGRMPCAPDVAPAFGPRLARADIDILADLDRAALRQIRGVEPRSRDRRLQHVRLQSGEGRCQKDVVGRTFDQ